MCLNNRSQDTDVHRHGVRRRQVYVYCSCFRDHLSILSSNNWYQEPRLGSEEQVEDVDVEGQRLELQ